MAFVKFEDIIGFEIEQQVVCTKCATKEETDNVRQEDILTESARDEETLIFCDRCNEQF